VRQLPVNPIKVAVLASTALTSRDIAIKMPTIIELTPALAVVFLSKMEARSIGSILGAHIL